MDRDSFASRQPEIEELPPAVARTEPVARDLVERPRVPRWRWIVALVVVALVATATVAGAVLLTGARAASTVARWAPADALVYVEVRPDLPGDQRDQLAGFLSAFPGFSDRSILDRKLTEIYDKLLSGATKGTQTYSGDIAPWFGGQLGASVLAPAGLATSSATGPAAATPRMLLVATSTDAGKATAWFRATATHAGATVTTADAGGTQLVLAADHGQTIAGAAPEGVLLVGDEASVRAAVSRGAGGGLAADGSFQAALAALPGDSLATAYVHLAAYTKLLAELPRPSGMPTPDLASLMPAWSAISLRAESDALSVEATSPATSLMKSASDGPSALAGRLPATTLALLDAHDVGHTITASLEAAGGSQQAEVEKALSRVGGLHGLVGWIGEAAIAVVGTPNGPLPGVVAQATDAKAAAGLSGSLSNLATIGGLKPTDTTYAGHTITTVDLPRDMAGAPLPGGVSAPPTTATTISWTVDDDLFIAGVDQAFVKAVLDTKAGASLADSARFRDATGRLSSSNHGLAWIDLAAVREALVTRLPAGEKTRYEADIAPYVAPFSTAVGVVTHDGSLVRARGLLILTRP